MSAPTFTVLIPTHDHADTLWYAVQSVLAQTRQDFELFIVGDGVPQRTREIAAALSARDPRIRFFDNPKGERHGEAHRHAALQEASGRFVCYQSDDDLWFPEHLAQMAAMLETHQLAHTLRLIVWPDGRALTGLFDARHAGAVELMRASKNGFGLSCGGHTLEDYRRLPTGWCPAPTGINTDLHFWLQWLDQPWCRYTALQWPTVCHLSSALRKDWSIDRRVAELAAWWPRVRDPAARGELLRDALQPLLAGVPPADATSTALQQQAKHIERLRLRADRLRGKLAGAAKRVKKLEAERAALRHSLSWKLTAPLRWLAKRLTGRA